MKNFFRRKASPVIVGLLAAFVTMTVFEYVNSFFYPLPENLDRNNMAAVQNFTASLPWTAYLLVLGGWIVGSFVAGYVTTYFSQERTYRLSLIVGVILTVLGVINNILIGHDMVFNLIGPPMFLIFTYLGNQFLSHRQLPQVSTERSSSATGE